MALPESGNYVTVSFYDVNNGAMANEDRVWMTTNRGQTWTAQKLPSGLRNINGISYVDANSVTAVGAYGTILRWK